MSSTIEASRSRLREQFVGKDIRDVPCPSAILDVAIIRRNCQRMLASCQDLDFGFRAHVKTHKVSCTYLIPKADIWKYLDPTRKHNSRETLSMKTTWLMNNFLMSSSLSKSPNYKSATEKPSTWWYQPLLKLNILPPFFLSVQVKVGISMSALETPLLACQHVLIVSI